MYNIKKILGCNLRKHRKKKSYTQEQLAELLSLQPQMIRNIEAGKNFISANTLKKICNVLNISPNILFNPYEIIIDSDDEIIKEDIVRNLDACSPARLKIIHQTVNMLLSTTFED